MSLRVRFAMHTKGLRFEEHRLDLYSGDQLRMVYQAFNPRGVVPTLVRGPSPVIDSSVFMEFLADIYPEIVLHRILATLFKPCPRRSFRSPAREFTGKMDAHWFSKHDVEKVIS